MYYRSYSHLLAATGYFNSSPLLKAPSLPPNETIAGLASGLVEAHKAYGVSGCVIALIYHLSYSALSMVSILWLGSSDPHPRYPEVECTPFIRLHPVFTEKVTYSSESCMHHQIMLEYHNIVAFVRVTRIDGPSS